MCIDTTKGNRLSLCADVGDEQLVRESPIVTMVLLYAHPMCSCIILEGVFGLQGLFAIRRLLKVDEAEAAEMIDEDGCCCVTAGCRYALELGDQTRRRRSHLVYGDTLSWRGGDFDAGKWGVGRRLGAPWAFGCFAVEASGAFGDSAGCQPTGEVAVLSHELDGGKW